MGSASTKEWICVRGTRNTLEQLEHMRWGSGNDGVGTLD